MEVSDYFKMDKQTVYSKCKKYWIPSRVDEWKNIGIDMIMKKREGYYFWDYDGNKFIDVHINGGVHSLGHRNPEVKQALIEALDYVDIGNHHFSSPLRAAACEKLISVSPKSMTNVVFSVGGGDAVDLAIKSARAATGRKKIVSIIDGFHGHTGLAIACGNDKYSSLFQLNRGEDENIRIPYNDLESMEEALKHKDVAGVLIETLPATYGFPLPIEGYHKGVKALCEKYGTLYIADEVQTGLMRSGEMWAITKYGVEPDIIVSAKGLTGGLYPISAVILNEKSSYWTKKNSYLHCSTTAGSEVGLVVMLKVLEILTREDTKKNVDFVTEYLGNGIDQIIKDNNDTFLEKRQLGTIMGLKFVGEKGALTAEKHLYNNGVWAMYSGHDLSVLQFKPGILCSKELCDELLGKMRKGIAEAKEELLGEK